MRRTGARAADIRDPISRAAAGRIAREIDAFGDIPYRVAYGNRMGAGRTMRHFPVVATTDALQNEEAPTFPGPPKQPREDLRWPP